MIGDETEIVNNEANCLQYSGSEMCDSDYMNSTHQLNDYNKAVCTILWFCGYFG